MSTPPALAWVRTHPVLAGALLCALVGTAHAEYTLATATHVNEYVAIAVPGALDLYVIQALRVRRDVATAVLVMVLANVTSHLLAAGLVPDDIRWGVGITAAVGALAPGIVWRVHSLERVRTRQELLWDLKAGTADAFYSGAVKPPEGPVPTVLTEWEQALVTEYGREFVLPETGPDIAPVLNYDWTPHPSVPDAVPEEWSTAEYGDPDSPIPYLSVVPDPEEPEPVPVTEVPGVLRAEDYEYVAKAKEYARGTENPTVAGMKRALGVGQERATRLLRYLGVLPK